jgi:hypothetical protein
VIRDARALASGEERDGAVGSGLQALAWLIEHRRLGGGSELDGLA